MLRDLTHSLSSAYLEYGAAEESKQRYDVCATCDGLQPQDFDTSNYIFTPAALVTALFAHLGAVDADDPIQSWGIRVSDLYHMPSAFHRGQMSATKECVSSLMCTYMSPLSH